MHRANGCQNVVWDMRFWYPSPWNAKRRESCEARVPTLFFTDFFDFTSIGFFVHLKWYPYNVFLTCYFTERLAVLKHFWNVSDRIIPGKSNHLFLQKLIILNQFCIDLILWYRTSHFQTWFELSEYIIIHKCRKPNIIWLKVSSINLYACSTTKRSKSN